MKRYSVNFVLSLVMIGALTGCATSNKSTVLPPNQTTKPSNAVPNTTSKNTTKTTASNPPTNENGKSIPDTSVSVPTTKGSPSTAQFASIVTHSMQYVVNRTQIPLMAPTEPTYHPNPYENEKLNAQVTASSTKYDVTLQWADEVLPINSPVLSQSPSTALVNMIGIFGAESFQSGQLATEQLYKPVMGAIDPSYVEPPSGTYTTVDLGHGIKGRLYQQEYGTFIQWQEGEWTLQVTGGDEKYTLPEAEKLVTYFDANLLPETQGVFGVNMAGDGDHTSAKWVFNNVVYSCSDYHSALGAAHMAVSMRSYPNGNLKP